MAVANVVKHHNEFGHVSSTSDVAVVVTKQWLLRPPELSLACEDERIKLDHESSRQSGEISITARGVTVLACASVLFRSHFHYRMHEQISAPHSMPCKFRS